jgi:hypothetical protein
MTAAFSCRLCGEPLTRTFVDLGMSPLEVREALVGAGQARLERVELEQRVLVGQDDRYPVALLYTRGAKAVGVLVHSVEHLPEAELGAVGIDDAELVAVLGCMRPETKSGCFAHYCPSSFNTSCLAVS